MDFASPNQVLVSRSFYDVAWCISEEYSGMFSYYGIRKDKHSREHALYEVALRTDEEEFIDVVEDHAEPEADEFTRIVRSRLASDTSPLTDADWNLDTLRRVENDLMQYVGPLAKVLVRKEANKTLSVEDLYVRLARAIPPGPERGEFMEKIADQENTGPTIQAPTEHSTPSETTVDDVPSTADNLRMEWTPEVLETAKVSLAPYVGPLASMLVRKASRRTTSVVELYDLLSQNIDDPEERKHFLSQTPGAE